jgi:PTS system glucose-specific IIC component
VELYDVSKARPDRLKALGAAGVMNVGHSLQAVFGTRSENLKSDMEEYLKTPPAVEDDAASPSVSAVVETVATAQIVAARDPAAAAKATGYIDALGGRENIEQVAACAVTRLRVIVRNANAVDEAALAAAGAQGMMRVGDSAMHVIVGPHADDYAAAMRSQLV